METEFSYKDFLVYIIRKWIILAICVILGVGVSIIYYITYKKTDIRVYEGSVTFNVENYVAYKSKGSSGKEDYSWYKNNADIIIANMASNDLIKTSTYDSVKAALYPNEKDSDRTDFFSNLIVKAENQKVLVRFAFDVQNPVVDVNNAKNVVNTYLSEAIRFAITEDATLDNSDILKKAEAAENKNTEALKTDFNLSSNSRGSLLIYILAGVAGGIIAGLLIGAAVYFIDPRIKSFKHQIDKSRNNLIAATAKINPKSNDVLMLTDTVRIAKGFKTLLYISADGTSFSFANNYASYLTKYGIKVMLLNFTDEKPKSVSNFGYKDCKWREYFSDTAASFDDAKNYDIILMALSSDKLSEIGNLACYAEMALMIFDYKKINLGKFNNYADAAECGGCKIAGSILYNTTDSFVD